LRRDARAADAVERRRGIGDLDERGKPDAAMDVLLAQARLLGAQARVIHHAQNLVERGVMRQPFEFQS
jgi:hypothetical protein